MPAKLQAALEALQAQQPPCPLPQGCRSCRSRAAPRSHAAPRAGPLLQVPPCVPPPLQGSCNTRERWRSPGAAHPLAFSGKVCNAPSALCWCRRCPACIRILVQFMFFEVSFFLHWLGPESPSLLPWAGGSQGAEEQVGAVGVGPALTGGRWQGAEHPTAPSHPCSLLPASALRSYCGSARWTK